MCGCGRIELDFVVSIVEGIWIIIVGYVVFGFRSFGVVGVKVVFVVVFMVIFSILEIEISVVGGVGFKSYFIVGKRCIVKSVDVISIFGLVVNKVVVINVGFDVRGGNIGVVGSCGCDYVVWDWGWGVGGGGWGVCSVNGFSNVVVGKGVCKVVICIVKDVGFVEVIGVFVSSDVDFGVVVVVVGDGVVGWVESVGIDIVIFSYLNSSCVDGRDWVVVVIGMGCLIFDIEVYWNIDDIVVNNGCNSELVWCL